MDCAEAKLQIEPYVTGEIPADEKSSLEEHLAACGECRLDVELTRASRNAPQSGDSNIPPALAEPMDPGGADGGAASASATTDEAAETEAGHAAGAAAKASPDAALSPGERPASAAGEGWTLETIFGGGGPGARGPGAGGPGAGTAAPPTRPAPPSSVAPPSGTDGDGEHAAPRAPTSVPVFSSSAHEALPPLLTPRSKAEEPPHSDAPTWDFEPAEATGKARPPEGSLFFAEAALARGTPPKKRSEASRMALWAGGGVLGLALLAASIWIAFTVHPPLPSAVHGARPPREDAGRESQPTSPTVSGGNDATPATPAPAGSTGTAPGADAGIPVSAPAPATAPTPAPPAAAPEQPTGRPLASETEPSVAPAPAAPRHPPATRAPATHAPARRPGLAASSRKAGATVAARPRATTQPEVFSPRPPAGEASRGPESGASPTGSANESAPPGEAPARGAGGAPAPETTAPPKVAQPAPEAGAPEALPSEGEAVQRPIDRLHLATLTAEQNADLPGLRKLRDSWRNVVKTTLGPDRARAKRELADCLWAIQTLTSKTSDQKEALAAYRDYVLNAPAGGADPRTVARMRQLEDALTDSR